MKKNTIKKKNDYNNMPSHIKRFFLYRKVYRDIYLRKKNAGFIVTGATGSGKSEFALKLASDLDPTFNVERVVYTAEDFLKLIVDGDSNGKIGIGKAIIFDETSHDEAMDSRASLSKTNKQMASLATIYRALRLIVIYVAPNLNQIDSRVRAISITGLIQMKSIDYASQMSKADLFWSVQNSRSGDVYYKRPRIINDQGKRVVCMSIKLSRPNKELRKAYEYKKMDFIKDKIARWNEKNVLANQAEEEKPVKMSFTEMVAKVLKEKEKYQINGKVNTAKIMQHMNIGSTKACKIAVLANDSI